MDRAQAHAETKTQSLVWEDIPSSLRIATLNLWGWFGEWPERRKILEQSWSRIDADVLLVQEGCARRQEDQIDELADRLGYSHVVTAVGERDAQGTESVAILSRYPYLKVITESMVGSTPARAMARATMDIEGYIIEVSTAHIQYQPPEVRYAQLVSLLSTKAPMAIIGGSLNAAPEDIWSWKHDWQDSLKDINTPTWPTDEAYVKKQWLQATGSGPTIDLSPRRLDYLLSRNLQILDRGVVALHDGPVYASDHKLIWTDYLLPAQTTSF